MQTSILLLDFSKFNLTYFRFDLVWLQTFIVETHEAEAENQWNNYRVYDIS